MAKAGGLADRLYVLDLGALEIDQERLPLRRRSERWITTTVPAYLIQAGSALILFDTGCSEQAILDPKGAWGRMADFVIPRVGPANDLREQLRLAGFTPDDVTHVVLSHLHFDHAGGVRLFRKAEVLVQKREYRVALYPDRGAGGYFPEDFEGAGARLRLLEGDAVIAPGVTAVVTDGHTPGHQSLVIDLADAGTVVLAADAAYFREELDRDLPSPNVVDPAAALYSIRRLKAIAERAGGSVWPNHDPAFSQTLRKAPAFYA